MWKWTKKTGRKRECKQKTRDMRHNEYVCEYCNYRLKSELKCAKENIKRTNQSLSVIAHQWGFSISLSLSHFNSLSSKYETFHNIPSNGRLFFSIEASHRDHNLIATNVTFPTKYTQSNLTCISYRWRLFGKQKVCVIARSELDLHKIKCQVSDSNLSEAETNEMKPEPEKNCHFVM